MADDDSLVQQSELRIGLFRQRRQLLVLTFILIAHHALGVTIEPHVALGGGGLNVPKESMPLLLWLLWLGWGYSGYRYWQYTRALPHHKIRALRNRVVIDEIIERFGRQIIAQARTGDQSTLRLTAIGSASIGPSATGGASVKGLVLSGVGVADNITGAITAAQLMEAQHAAKRRVRMTHYYFTDFYAPYWFAALAPVAAAYDVWPLIVWAVSSLMR